MAMKGQWQEARWLAKNSRFIFSAVGASEGV